MHVEVASYNYRKIFWENDIVEAVYRPAVAIVSSPLVVHVYYKCGRVLGLVDL